MSKILVIDSQETIKESLTPFIVTERFEILSATNIEKGLETVSKRDVDLDVVIIAIDAPDEACMDLLKHIKKAPSEISVIILTDQGNIENATAFIKEGAFEYLKTPISTKRLLITINNAIKRKLLIVENNKMQAELVEHKNYLQSLHDSAQKILLNMLPKKIPDIPGFKFDIAYKSADVVGGDMYDICDIGDYVCFYVFDVASHGILSSVVATILKSFLQNIEYNYKQGINKRRFPEIVMDLNLELQACTAQNIFATLFLGFIDKKSKVFYYVSAGHIPQYIVCRNGLRALDSTGPLLGVFEDATYSCRVIQLNECNKILLFTDGIIEASSGDNIYGDEKLEALLTVYKEQTISLLVKALLNEVSVFAGGRFLDDITILGIEIQDSDTNNINSDDI